MVNENQSRADVVIFGASGFTGERVVRVAIRRQRDDPTFTFKVAGRNLERLRTVLERCKEVTGFKEFKVDLIQADLDDPDSIRKMCIQARVLINCVGPYRFYGEQVVEACIEVGTNYVDISGEPQFLEKMQLKYDQKAKEKSLYIVGSCGFDSIPSEMGIAYMKDCYKGDLESVESYMSFKSGPEGVAVHYATWESAVNSLAAAGELKPLRRELYKTRLPKPEHKMHEMKVHYNDDAGGYSVPFPGSDRAVARRTEYLSYIERQERPIQVFSYLNVGSMFNTVKVIVFGVMFALLANFGFTRNLLLKYPKLFSFGLFSHEGPTEEQIKNTSFLLKLIGHGYPGEKLPPTEVHTDEPNQKIVVDVIGPEPGYAATSIFVFDCAMVLLEESELSSPKIPRYGILTPGYAFARTSLIKKLRDHGINFEVTYQGAVSK